MSSRPKVNIDSNSNKKTKFEIIDIEGGKIFLTKIDESHLPDMYEYSSDPEFYKHMEMGPHKSINETKQYFKKLQKYVEDGALYWSIISKESNKMIGTIGIRKINWEILSAEIGIGISPKYWYTGIAFEVLYLVFDYCLNKLNFKFIYNTTSLHNKSALKLSRTLGFTNEKVLKDFYISANKTKYDGIYAELSKESFNNNELSKKIKSRIVKST